MDGVQGACHLAEQAQGARLLERPSWRTILLRSGPGHEPHRDVEVRAGEASCVDGDDVRMLDSDRVVDLALKASPRLVVVGELREQHLERDATTQREVLGLVDGSHAALAQDRDGPEVSELVADQGVACRHVRATVETPLAAAKDMVASTRRTQRSARRSRRRCSMTARIRPPVWSKPKTRATWGHEVLVVEPGAGLAKPSDREIDLLGRDLVDLAAGVRVFGVRDRARR